MGILTRFLKQAPSDLDAVPNRGGWFGLVREPFTGAWQRNKELKVQDMHGYHAVFSCITLIAGDLSKMSLDEVRKQGGIWPRVPDSPVSRRLRNPNLYQNGGQFVESWAISKLARGNTYVLKEPRAGEVPRLHVLHPDCTRPLVAPSGDVYYELSENRLAGVPFDDSTDSLIVPASEIIHDRFNCLYHPLVGLSPLYAAALAVAQGREIQNNSIDFFNNGAMPGGVLTAPGAISDATAQRLKATWESQFAGRKKGGLAVLGDGMEYKTLSLTAQDSQLIEQLKWSAQIVCSVFHVPPYKIGVGDTPSYDNVQALNQEYFSQCLQRLIVDMQRLLREGLNLTGDSRVRFDLDSLLMMDTKNQMEVLERGAKIGAFEPNLVRAKFNQPPVEGGEVPYLQQQNWPLQSLASRPAPGTPAPAPAPDTPPEPVATEDEAEARALIIEALTRKELFGHA